MQSIDLIRENLERSEEIVLAAYAANHWFMHRGHLADARRAAGLDRMWF